ncbi:unnamed protein product, partial [marine sediment metagenome]
IGNIFADPLFVTGPLGDYYLSQFAGGQISQSLCVNNGTNNAPALSPNGYTTSTLNTPESSPVDMGYHYPDSGDAAVHMLITGVPGGHGSIEPNHPAPGAATLAYTQVVLHAVPDTDYRIVGWTGLDDDDMLLGLDSAVILMDSDKEIYVTFEPDVNILSMFVEDSGDGQGHGTLTANPTAPGNAYFYGEVVTLTADPNEGYGLVYWAGDVDNPNSTGLTNTVTMTGNKAVSVKFS